MDEVTPEVEVIRVTESGKVQGVPWFTVETRMYVPAQKYSKGALPSEALGTDCPGRRIFNGGRETLFRRFGEGSRKTKVQNFCFSCYLELAAVGGKKRP